MGEETPRVAAGYRSPRSLAIPVQALLILVAVLGVLIADLRTSEVHELIKIRHGAAFIANRLTVSGRGARALQVPAALALALLVPSWLAWQWRVRRNTVALGVRGLRFASTPAFVAGWVVPGANLVLPYLAVREAWRANDPEAGPTDCRRRPVAIVVTLWWLAFLAFAALVVALALAWPGPHARVPAQITRDELVIPAGIALAAAAVLGAVLVMLLNGRQEQKRQGFTRERWAAWSRPEP